MRPEGSNSKILTWREYFASELFYASNPESSPSGFFTRFGHPTTKNYKLVFLTSVRPKPGFCSFEVRSWVKFSNFWPGKTSNLYTNGQKSFPPGFFTHFGRPMIENHESVFLTGVRLNGAFDRCATRKDLKNPLVTAGLKKNLKGSDSKSLARTLFCITGKSRCCQVVTCAYHVQ